jgi:hypothetical protein
MKSWIKYFKKIKISMYISIYGFQKISKFSSFVLMASHYFPCKKNHSTKHFNKYVESLIIWYDYDASF